MLQRLREFLTLALIALLPFHAFLVTVKTRFLLGPGHAPMPQLALWKEGLLAIILLVAVIEIAISGKRLAISTLRRIDVIDGLIVGLLLLGITVSFFIFQFSILNSQFIYGVRYDFIPLITFVILRRVPWSDLFLKRVMNLLVAAGAIVALYGIVSFFLPATFFTWLGYSDLHSLYLPDGPLAPFQQIGGTSLRRIQSVMSGPNQLGLWLLVPLSVILSSTKDALSKSWFVGHTMTLLAALLLSFSRAAWMGAAVIVVLAAWPCIRALSKKTSSVLVSSVLLILTAVALFFPSVLLRAASSRGHIENPLRAIQTMVDHPLGLGLGTAGPASNRTSDACVMLEEGSDASWAADRADLCVFVGQTQVQPVDRTCSCPLLPENWYLQIGVEMGWIGICVYLALVIVVLKRLWELRVENGKLKMNEEAYSKFSILNTPFSMFLAVSIAALFLHAWEDAAVAYTMWILIAATLPVQRQDQR